MAAAAAAERSSVVFRTLLLLVTVISVQGSAQLSCSPGWTLHGDQCYRLYTTLLSWQGALDVCRTDGAYLARIEDIYTNARLGSLASASSISHFWIGLNRISVPDSNTTYGQWSDGAPSSMYQAFWDELQPDLDAGDCSHVSESQGQYRWAMGTCEWKRAFVCEVPACPSGSFQCSSGECVQSSRTCDTIQDCSDGSDEINCPSLCKEYLQGTGGNILSANFPGGYAINSDCQWTIEGPLGSNIFLQVNVLDTEVDKDEVIVMGGGKTPSTSYNLQRMSGVTPPSAMIHSYNNFMIIRFYSDGAVQGTGFNLTWSAVEYSIPDEGQPIEASQSSVQLRAPLYSAPYLNSQESVWVIHTADERSVITLQREDIDLAPGDYIYVRDGSDASAPLLAEYSGMTGPLYVLSTGPYLYILMKTGRNIGTNNRGFVFSYVSGCKLSLTENTGKIFSPGYGVVNYANYVTCTYVIQPNAALRTTLRFDPQYDVEYQNDKLQVYVGQDNTGTPVHNVLNGGFIGTDAPAPVTASNGNLFVQFQTNAIDSRAGWRAVYSNSCPSPTFTPETICTPSCSRFDYGDAFNVSCPAGYVFDSLEFYMDQGGSSMESMDVVHMECLPGGSWNVRRYPQCVPIYCGQAPEINNGYVESATGAVFGSTATYLCAEGYSTAMSTTITCQQNGTWETLPVCAGETCPSLTTWIAWGNSQLAEGNGADAGSVYRFDCDSGYTLSGSPILHCNSSGQWSHPAPTCQKVQCLVPTLPNGNIIFGSGSLADYDSVLPVVCDTPAYELVGNATIRCLADQSFSPLPECKDVNECNAQPCPANAECVNTVGSYECPCLLGFQKNGALCSNIDECSDNNGGCSDTCTDTEGSYACGCPEGYALYTQNGTEGYIIPKMETGLRFGETFYLNHTCVRNQCPMPVSLPNGYPTEARMQYNYGDSVTFLCNHGHILSGQDTLQCQANGTWSADFPTCEVAMCPPDQIPQGLLTAPQSVVPSGEVEFGATVFINCNVSGKGLFIKKRTCRFEPGQQVYRLQGESYECGVVDCGTPLLPPGGLAIPPPAATTFHNTFPFTCDYMYDLQGSNNLGTNIITCTADYTWTFFDITCIKRQCPYPGVPAGGNVTFDGNGFDYYDNATFTCLRGGFEPEVQSLRCGVSEDGKDLSWGKFNTTPACVDVEPPTFVDCPSSPVRVNRYDPAGFSVPTASDNSGSVSTVMVTPAYFYPTQPVSEDVTVNYTAVDHIGLTAECIVSIVVTDSTPPVIQCPNATVLTLSSAQGGFTVFDPSSVSVTYNASDAALTFSPSAPFNFSYSDVGKTSVVKVTATDNAGNTASCLFQVVVRAATCEPDTLSSANTQRQCVSTSSGGYSCTFSCKSGFQFYEDYPQESFTTTCEPGQSWSQPYVPSCVESAPVGYNLVIELQHQANPAESLTNVCQQSYTSALLLLLQNSGVTLKQICSSQTEITAVTYNDGSLQSTYDDVTMQLKHEFSVLLESQTEPLLQYLQCYNSILAELTSMASTDSAVSGGSSLASWKTLSPTGCTSISVNGTQPLTSTLRTCASDYLRREVNGFVVCLPCPPGTSKSSSGTCELCAVGQYWVAGPAPLYGQCVDCSRGQATAGEGGVGAESCIELCEGNLVSATGVPPCRECDGNSFAVNASVCQQCPNDTRALRKENPLSADCNTKLCTYSSVSNVQLLSPVVQAQTLTISQCQDLCERWETLPFTSSMCVGFNYEKILGLCLLYDRESRLETNVNYDYYERRCLQRDLTECYCAPECSAGYYSITGYMPDCRPCPVGFFSTSASATYCQECPAGQTTRSQAATVCVADAASVVCQNNPCQNNGICSVLLHDAFCTCQPGYTGRYCEKSVDFCASSPCYNGGTCTSASQGFSCSCPSGFRGQRCEENIDDCAGESCSRRGTCVDGVNSFTCDCVDNYAGTRCEQRVQNGCDYFPCGNNSVCRPVNDYHRECDCNPGYTGPNCDMEIDECESEPCQNGGTCVDKVDSFECDCRPNFTGMECQDSAKYCGMTICGASDNCLDDPVTGLPLCICSSGFTQGEICQYSFRQFTDVNADSIPLEAQNASDSVQCRSLCDARGDQCRAFVYELLNGICRLYSHVNSTVALNPSAGMVASLSVKSCSYPREDYFYTEWFNTVLASLTGSDREMYSMIQQMGMTVCENTDPIGVECRQIGSQGAIPATATCDLSGLTCSLNGTNCPDMEIRFQCARSRVMEGKICSVRDVCSEGHSCSNNGQCINDPSDIKGYRCLCPVGFTGDLCQLTWDECASQPCLNDGTCVDGDQAYTCSCLPGFEGDRCETDPDDCNSNFCDAAGTLRCEDEVNDYTCVCRPGYSGRNCSVNIDECESNPCFHGATCTDQVNGYTCDCLDGWTGQRCETIVDRCSTTTCFFNSNCTTLFNDFMCRCSPGTFGTQCQNNPSINQCSFNNPCVNTGDCALSGSQAVCNCQDGTTGTGCELYTDDSCDNTACQNEATCKETASGPACVCPDGYSGDLCQVNTDDCGGSSCSSAATCIDGINEHFCRCPVGKALPDCVADIDEDYDMCFSPSLTTAGAALPYAVSVPGLDGFTLMVWVRFEQKGGTGTFLSVYTKSSTSVTTQRTEIIRLDESGMQVNLFGSQTLSHRLFPINDGLWHLVVLFWNSASGDLDLTVDYLRQDRILSYGVGQTITGNLWIVLGGAQDASPSSGNVFQGCVSGIDVLNYGLDFTADLPSLQEQPSNYRGDVLRWAEFADYGNTWFVRPSQARLVNCVTNPSEPLCIDQSRDTPAPLVTTCPDDIIVDTIYSDAYAKWTEPTFSGIGISVSASHQSGSLFQRGSTAVVYVAKNQEGNTAVCSFNVFVGDTTCPAQEPPRGGGMQNCQLQMENFDACSVSCPAANSTLVGDVPDYYTCGPSGAWATLQDHEGIYPTCGRIVGPAQADVKLELTYYISTGECSTITQGIVTRSREELAALLQAWGGQLCQSSDCSDVTPVVDCSTVSKTRVEIPLTNVSALLNSGSTQLTVEDLWLTSVLDNGVFSFDTIIPGAQLDDQLYSVQVTYICEEGQVVRDKMCVECGPGTFYNSTTGQCDNCPVGQYMSGYAALSCTPCPNGQTTPSIGSTRLADCAESCPAGQFYNGSGCVLCPMSFYQNETGQFECKPCPRGYLTLEEGTASADSCAEGCESGYELLVNGTCVPCSEGTYRQYGMDQTCQPCPPAYTTPTVASVSADNCTVLKCPAGSKANATVTGCELCPVGQYQPLVNQLDCNPCPVNFTTAQPGSTLDTQCQQFCPSGYEVVSGQCEACPVATYKDNSVDPLSSCLSCPAEYLTASDTSTSISDCSIRNCSAGFFIQSDGQGVETCALCPVDQYNPQPYQHSCQPCPAGNGTRQPGADNEALCEAVCDSGEELVNGTCTPCPQGSYKNNSDDRFGQCSSCPVDFITPSSGATALDDCNIRNCSAGSYRDENNNTCVACPLNTYQPDRWQTSCLPCPKERLTENTGATSEAQCLLSCSPGREDENGTCTECPVGFYKNQTGAISCSACPEGLRTAGIGSINEADCSVAACKPGTYLNATGNVCVDCPYGHYQPDLWQDSCLPCPGGTTTFVEGASLLTQCLKNCPAGKELNLNTDVCDPCERGYYRDKSSATQTACVLCPEDFITAGTGSALATDCSVVNCTAPGRYLNVGANVCDECPVGTYNSQWWAEACTPCPSGFTTKTTGLPTVDTCYSDCPSGQQVKESSNVCTTCEKGTYRDRAQTWTCQPCPSFLTTAGTGATSVSACDIPTCGPGYYYFAQQSECIICALGTYQSQSGSRSCDTCPDHKTTLSTGRVSSDDCISLCQTIQNTCSSNAACSVGDSGNLQCTCNKNYQGDGYSCNHVCDLPEAYCLNGATCYKDRAEPCVCGDYYSGTRCQNRADPSKSTSDTEIIVGTVIGVVALLLILLLILIGIIVRRRRARRIPDKDSLSTTNSQSQAPSVVIPRANLQNYHRSLNSDQKSNRSYDPAYYSASEANRDLPFIPYDNVTYR